MVTSTPVQADRPDSSLEEISIYEEFGIVIVWPAHRRHIGNMPSLSSEPDDEQESGEEESSVYLPTP